MTAILVKKVICTCGSEAVEVDTTTAEIAAYGCPEDKPDYHWCVTAYECAACNERWVFVLEAPRSRSIF